MPASTRLGTTDGQREAACTPSAVGTRADRVGLSLGPPLCGLAVVVLVAIAEHYHRLYRRNVVDDAATSMQYAKNLALGHGLVFNVGERVEGYTNFLWVVFQVPLYLVARGTGITHETLLVQATIAIAAAVVVLMWLIGRRLWGESSLIAAAVLGLCVLDGSFGTWTVFGLECHFLALWLLLAVWLVACEARLRWLWLGLTLAAAQLTRPDAGLFCVVLLGGELIEAWRIRSHAVAREALAAATVWLGIYGLYFVWRWHYYGQLFPNTYYLKLGGAIDAWARGAEYLRTFFATRAWIPAAGLLSLLSAKDRVVRLLLAYLTLHCAYVLYVGGDFFSGHRFLVPEIPMFALLAGVALQQAWRLVKSARAASWLTRIGVPPETVAGAAAVALGLLLGETWTEGRATGPLQEEILTWRDNLSSNRSLMSWLGQHAPPDGSIATCLIGHTGYFSGLRVIDICGVIDPVIAHWKVPDFGHGKPGHEKLGSASYVLSKHPTYFIDGYLPIDLWQNGYYFSDAPPLALASGIFVRDTLPERGHYEESGTFAFEQHSAEWLATGTAFEHWPSHRNERGQGKLTGVSGGFINSFHPSLQNEATGRLASPPFRLLGDRMLLRVAGGHDPERLRVSLLVDGQRVFDATGRESDALTRREWDIRQYRGRDAVLEIVDDARGPWGYIALDEVRQWSEGQAK